MLTTVLEYKEAWRVAVIGAGYPDPCLRGPERGFGHSVRLVA